MAIFHILTKLIISPHSMSVPVYYTVGRVGNRYVWQGGQTENQGRQTKNFFRRFAPNFIKQMFAHPGLKPCRRPWLYCTCADRFSAVKQVRCLSRKRRCYALNRNLFFFGSSFAEVAYYFRHGGIVFSRLFVCLSVGSFVCM